MCIRDSGMPCGGCTTDAVAAKGAVATASGFVWLEEPAELEDGHLADYGDGCHVDGFTADRDGRSGRSDERAAVDGQGHDVFLVGSESHGLDSHEVAVVLQGALQREAARRAE